MVDVLVIGGGLAGWRAAEAAVECGCRVRLIANGAGNSPHIHALNCPVLPEDSVARHMADTLASGHGTNDPELVRVLCEGAAKLKDEFAFDRGPDGAYKLLQPLGSSVPRCVMMGPAVGAEILHRLQAKLAGRVEFVEGTVERIDFSEARAVVLATGGWCGRYEFSTNPKYLKGDGIRLAEALGAATVDMDQVQYEPTAALEPPVLRGIPVITTMLFEGATFRNRNGEEFLADKTVNKDELSKAILREVAAGRGVLPTQGGRQDEASCPRRSGDGRDTQGGAGQICGQDASSCRSTGGVPLRGQDALVLPIPGQSESQSAQGVWYDATQVARELLTTKYAPLVKRYADAGVDITKEWMLVAPAPHTSLGGLKIDTACRVLDRTGAPIPGLFAAGEVTGGLHGANRLGGNAGSEVLVFGRLAGLSAARFAKGNNT